MSNDFGGKKRSELPDNVFGIPQERKYPMPDEKHTRSAIKLFNHVEPKYEEQLAKAVIKNMKKYNIDGSVVGPNNRLRKYLPKDMIKEYVEEACKDLTHARKLCNAVRKLARKYNANYFFVTDGASSYSNGNGKYNPAAKEMRDHMDDWERNNGFNPDDDWTNDINNVSNYRLLKESSVLEGLLKSDFSYTGIKTSTEKSEFKRNFREVFKEDPTESSINNMQMIKYKESLVGYIGFSRYTIDKKKYLGIGNFMIIKKYQHRGIGSKVISDIIDKYKDKYDEIYCYVDENNTNAISFYKKIAKVDTENLTRYGYYVSLYRKNKSSIKEETRIEDNKLPKHIYHISYINHDGETFEPRTYDNDNVKNGMERKVKRVCFSDSITRALYSIFPNGAYDADFYVHVPNSDCKVYKTTSDDIYDADITHELWIKEPVQMKCIGKIHVNGVSDKTHTIDVDKDKAGYGKKKYHETRWNWVEKYEKDETLYESYISEDDDMNKIAKEIVKTIKPIVLTSKNKQQASRIGLTLKCEVESLDHNTICILILDGSQDARDSKEARLLLSNIQNDCKSKLVGYVSKITIGDGDEGCLYFTPNKKYIEKNRKDLIQESSEYQIKQSEINDMKTVISSLNDDSFKGFNFKNIAYYDIRYRSKKPIAFITIRTKPINNCIVGYVSLAVDPKYQNQGIGKSLTKKAIQWFKRERGIGFLEWWCLPDNEASNKLANAAGFKEYIARDQSEYIQYTMESSISEYGTTAGAMVGSNQPDSVYIVNYMQNNVFSGHKEPKFGICKKGMKDLHIVGGKYNRFHYVSDVTKFKEEASDIHVYRYKGKPKNEFYDIIEDMDDDDLNIYKMVTGREIEDRSMIQFDGDFIEEDCFFDEIDAIKACTEAGLLEASTDLHPVPILTETVQGRPYNYYRDLNGVFIQHEITGLRSKSYETLDDIPEAEKDIVKRGYLV